MLDFVLDGKHPGTPTGSYSWCKLLILDPVGNHACAHTDYFFSSKLQVNNNGVISFERSVRQFTSNPFPLVENPDLMLIAPYWADVDTRGTGTVWYRQTSNEILLLQARRAIRSAFVNQMTFQPTMLFIATWDHVGHYNQRTSLVSYDSSHIYIL